MQIEKFRRLNRFLDRCRIDFTRITQIRTKFDVCAQQRGTCMQNFRHRSAFVHVQLFSWPVLMLAANGYAIRMKRRTKIETCVASSGCCTRARKKRLKTLFFHRKLCQNSAKAITRVLLIFHICTWVLL